jgi:DNA-binding CsgD family transcriptional regulator
MTTKEYFNPAESFKNGQPPRWLLRWPGLSCEAMYLYVCLVEIAGARDECTVTEKTIAQKAAGGNIVSARWYILELETRQLIEARASDGSEAKTYRFVWHSQMADPPDPDSPGGASKRAGLTVREREIVVCLANGMNDREISKTLEITQSTVNFHVQNLKYKLGATNRAHIVALVIVESSEKRMR